ncbi:hypothetical protein DIPPA_04925 [Diplonema papillatum]|nr:hypothetical protein DIPPA_04925 [Diplonema papillatum]
MKSRRPSRASNSASQGRTAAMPVARRESRSDRDRAVIHGQKQSSVSFRASFACSRKYSCRGGGSCTGNRGNEVPRV